MKYQHHTEGFVALMSVVIISAILLVLVFTLGASSFFNRFDALDAENKRVSLGLAEACVNVGMLRIAQANYTSGTIVVDGSKTCKICLLTPGGLIQTRAVYNGAYTNLQVAINNIPGSYDVTSWIESPTGPAGCVVP